MRFISIVQLSCCLAAAPSVPRNIRIVEVYKDYVTIAWDRPESDGGEPIIAYEIEKSLGGAMYVNAGRCEASVSIQLNVSFCKLSIKSPIVLVKYLEAKC